MLTVLRCLALQYYTKHQSCPSNPAFECTIDPKYIELIARKDSAFPSFGNRIQSVLDLSTIISNDNVHVIPGIPTTWILHHPNVCLDLSVWVKKDTPITSSLKNPMKLRMSILYSNLY